MTNQKEDELEAIRNFKEVKTELLQAMQLLDNDNELRVFITNLFEQIDTVGLTNSKNLVNFLTELKCFMITDTKNDLSQSTELIQSQLLELTAKITEVKVNDTTTKHATNDDLSQ